jgi:glucose/arabinose dehydrogenase/PKD repeat protein
MRRIAMLAVALTLGTVPLLGALPAEAALRVPGGFTGVNYDTGQAPYNLTNFAWVGDSNLLASGKDGTVTFVPSGGSPRVLATVPNVRAVGDHGLLGLAPANDYATTGRVFLSYDKGDPKGAGYGMLEEWKASPAANPTTFTRVRALVDGSTMSPQLTETGTTHGPDTVLVAPDDSLYWSIGDNAGNNGDPRTFRAQDLDQPYGKVLHLTAAGAALPTNPFYRSAAPRSWRSMIYAYGMRNPFRISLDPRSGVLQVGDVGWRKVEEVDLLPAGANAGWPCYEGNDKTTFSTDPACQALYSAENAVPPIWTYTHSGSGAAVTGGEFYTGTAYPAEYRNALFFGDYTRQQIWTLAADTGGRLTRSPEPSGFGADVGGPVAFHAGPNGDITYADILSGQVRRLVYGAGNRKPVAQLETTVDAATRTLSFSGGGSYDLDGDQLTYRWAFGDGGTATGASVRHTYAGAGPATVTLTVRDQLGAEGVTTTTVYPANHSPVVTLNAPSGRLYAVGEMVDLSATATDEEDGGLAVSWEATMVHCPFTGSCHLHPDGTSRGSTYREPFTDHGADTLMRITARATDSTGATTSRVYEAKPDLKTLAVVSPVAVNIDGTTAASAQVVAGAAVQVDAPVTSSFWHFVRWSDGGPAKHALTMPARDLTLTATYSTSIDQKYAELGGAGSVLGAPSGHEYDLAGGRGRTYARGRILWSATTGAHEVHGKILTKFLATGGVAVSGFPITDEIAVRGGRASSFTRARFYHSAGSGTHYSRGRLLQKYLAAGGPDRYGLPTTDDTKIRGGYYAGFTGHRSIYYSKANGAHLVYGSIRTRYGSMGYERSCLGFPTTDEYTVGTGRRNRFVAGRITWNATTHRTTAQC